MAKYTFANQKIDPRTVYTTGTLPLGGCKGPSSLSAENQTKRRFVKKEVKNFGTKPQLR